MMAKRRKRLYCLSECVCVYMYVDICDVYKTKMMKIKEDVDKRDLV